MNRLYTSHIVTSVIILIIQILLLKNIQIELFDRFTLSVLIYPAVILFLPVGVRRSVIIISAFFIGLLIDGFYDSPGVHTAALVFTAFIRATILRLLEPRQGYRDNLLPAPQSYGSGWFFSYLGILLFLHIFIYFSIDAFTYVFFLKIIVNTMCSFVISFLLLVLYKILL